MNLTENLIAQCGIAGGMLAVFYVLVRWLTQRHIPKVEASRDRVVQQMIEQLRSTLTEQRADSLAALAEQQRLFTQSLARLERFWSHSLTRLHSADEQHEQRLGELRDSLRSDAHSDPS